MKKFYRVLNEKMITGICQDISDYTGIDVNIIRLITIIIGLCCPFTTVIIYFVASIVAPSKNY